MTTFTPLDDSAGTNHRGAIVHRKRGQEPVGIVIDRSCRVYIANIPLSRIERDGVSALKGELEAYGPVESYRMFTDIAGRFTGAALCTYRNPADATMAVMSMNGQLIDDAVLSVTVARDHGVVMLRRSCNNSNINNTANDNVPLGKWGTMSASLLQAGEGGRRNRSNSYVGNSSLAESADNDDGKWRHDKYETHLGEAGKSDGQENVFNASFGSSPSTLRLRGRGGLRLSGARGGRGARCMTGAERVNMQFEQYVAERDRLLGTNVERSDGAHHHPCTATESSGGGNEQGTVVGDVFHDMTPARQHSDHREDTVRCDYQENLDADQAEAVPTSSSSQAPPSLMTNETHLHRAHADVQQQQQQQVTRFAAVVICVHSILVGQPVMMRPRHGRAPLTWGVSARMYSAHHMRDCEKQLLRYFGSLRALASFPMSGDTAALQSYGSENASALPHELLFSNSSMPDLRNTAPDAADETRHRSAMHRICASCVRPNSSNTSAGCAVHCLYDAQVRDAPHANRKERPLTQRESTADAKLGGVRGSDAWQHLRDTQSFRTLSNRFSNAQDSNKDSVEETCFRSISDDVADMWHHVSTAWQDIYDGMCEFTAAGNTTEQTRVMHRSRALPYPSLLSLLPSRVLFVIFFSHTRRSRAVTRAMHSIAQRVCCAVDSANAKRAVEVVHAKDASHTKLRAGDGGASMTPMILRVIPIYVGLPLPDMPIPDDFVPHTLSSSASPSLSSSSSSSITAPNINHALCYDRSGLYTLSAVLQCLTNLPPAHLTKYTTDDISMTHDLAASRLQRRVLVLSEAWLQPRSVAAIHETSVIGERARARYSTRCGFAAATASAAASSPSLSGAGSHSSVFIVPSVDRSVDASETVTEVIPGVVSERLSEVELDAFARYVVCRALSTS